METSIIIAGFGGQGVLLAGQLLAHAALAAGKEVTWIPSYGPEMRGGTAHCTVIISDELVGSPLVNVPDIAIAMNLPSAQKYAALMTANGHLLVNASLVSQEDVTTQAQIHWVPANQIAETCGSERAATVVMLGVLLRIQPILSIEVVADALESHLPQRHHHLLAANLNALRAGTAVHGA